jgi:hypothetical protein
MGEQAVNADLRKTNERYERRRERIQAYRQRTGKRRNQRRQVDLIVAGVLRGWIR